MNTTPNTDEPQPIPDGMKRCSKCGEVRPATAEYFYRNGRLRDGLRSDCKKCQVKYRQDNAERIAEYDHEYRQDNAEHIAEQKREYYRDNAEHIAEQQREYRRDNAEHIAEQQREYRRENQQTPRVREASRIRVARRKARKRSLPDTLTADEWQATLAHFDHRCAVCGRPIGLWHTLAMDHWIPLSSEECPGTVVWNIIPLCHGVGGCNNSKRGRDPEEWLIEKLGPRKGRRKFREIEEWLASQKGENR